MPIDEHSDWFDDLQSRLRTTTQEKAHRFAIACCRRSSHLLTDPRHQEAIAMAELFAEGKLSERQFEDALKSIKELWSELPAKPNHDWQTWHYLTSAIRHLGYAPSAASCASFMARAVATSQATEASDEWESALRKEEQALTELSGSYDALGSIPEKNEDPYVESDEWIAAEGRQLIRAMSAYDSKAIEVCLFFLSDYLTKILGRHLRGNPNWQFPGLWFDGLNAPQFNVQMNSSVRIRAWLVCVASQNEIWWREPFEFELRLYPRSGRFQGYRFRVGDSRSREEKAVVGLEIGMSRRIEFDPFQFVDLPPRSPEPVGGWAEEFIRGKVHD